MHDSMSRKTVFSAIGKLSTLKDKIQQGDIRGALPVRRNLKPGEWGYVEGDARKQSWSQWAGEKMGKRPGQGSSGVERIALFPGWATRRYDASSRLDDEQFDVEIFVSGYATSHRSPGSVTRAQRAFIRLAKGFASLPKIPGQLATPELPWGPLSPSTEDLLRNSHLPPPPDQINDESELQALEHQFRKLAAEEERGDGRISSESYGSATDTDDADFPSHKHSLSSSSSMSSASDASSTSSELQRLHANLEARLEPFWSSALSGRLVRITVFVSQQDSHASTPSIERGLDDSDDSFKGQIPVAIQDVTTGPDGSFQKKLPIPWDRMCTHPQALHMAFGDRVQEHEFYVRAELLPPPPPVSSNPPTSTSNHPYEVRVRSRPTSRGTSPAPTPRPTAGPTLSHPRLQTVAMPVPLTSASVRVISDIDDTVKLSNILGGARAVFHNVFAKDLRELVIPGMGAWYTEMWKRGVRFHYVSNGPFELLPVVNTFFQISQLPPGSIKLRSYAGRSLFNGLLSAPAARKRQGVLDILEAFQQSRFFLVGDTGEQDLELYSSIAMESPNQILGVFVRDVGASEEGVEPIEDPTGQKMLEKMRRTRKLLDRDRDGTVRPTKTPSITTTYQVANRPKRAMSDLASPVLARVGAGVATPKAATRTRSMGPGAQPRVTAEPAHDYFTSNGALTAEPDALPEEPSSAPALSTATPGSSWAQAPVSEVERRRWELQARVDRVRWEMPESVPLRVFRRPEECVEVWHILETLGVDAKRRR